MLAVLALSSAGKRLEDLAVEGWATLTARLALRASHARRTLVRKIDTDRLIGRVRGLVRS